jgi:hypothetical protein
MPESTSALIYLPPIRRIGLHFGLAWATPIGPQIGTPIRCCDHNDCHC